MQYMFIDESGDPAFYASGNKSIVGYEGFKSLLILGMVRLEDKKRIRAEIIKFIDDIKNDPLYNTLPCVTDKKGWYLHASYDNLEIRVKFIEFLRKLEGFKFYCVIGRKRLDVFHNKHNKNETEFYFDVVYHLLKDRLKGDDLNQIYLSARGKNNQLKLKQSIDSAILRDNNKRKKPVEIKYNCEIVLSKDTPELSIVDYLLWALQRYIISNDGRFYHALETKYNLIIDLYDFDRFNSKDGGTYYTPDKNKFTLEKASEFKSNGYIK